MATRKKKPRTKLTINMPIAMLAFYEGVAAYAGVSLDDCFNVILALRMMTDKPPPP